MAHLVLSAALPSTFFGNFMWVAILKLLLFGVFEMRTVVSIYQVTPLALTPYITPSPFTVVSIYQVTPLALTPYITPSPYTVVSIYQSRFSHELSLEGWEGLRRRLAVVHIRFYGALFVAVLLALYLRNKPVLLIPLFYSFWIPQVGMTGGLPSPLLSFSLPLNSSL